MPYTKDTVVKVGGGMGQSPAKDLVMYTETFGYVGKVIQNVGKVRLTQAN